MTEIVSVHVRISGDVQGVGFRAWAARRANSLGLSGWVRNMPNGDVEAVFRGRAADVDAVLAICRRGPPLARVARVETLGPAGPVEGAFVIRS